MIGRLLGNRTRRMQRTGPLAAVPTPPNAGVLSCRVLDPVNEPVPNAEFSVSDATGRKVVGGGTDPFGSFVATVPAGEYRLAVSAEGYTPYRASATVAEDMLSSLGDATLQVAQPPELPAPGDWEIEPTHSSIAFTARHIGLARIHGRFNAFAGAVRIADDMDHSAMHVVIDAASIDTNVRMRDDHLRSADFLDVRRFPTLEFYSDKFTHRGGNRWAVTGALSLPVSPARSRWTPSTSASATAWRARRGRPAGPPPSCTATTSRSAGRRCWRGASPWSAPASASTSTCRSCPRADLPGPPAGAAARCPTMAPVSDVRHVLVLPDRDAAEEAAQALGERFGLDEEPRLVRDALAGEDDAEDAQWLVVVRDEEERLDPGELDEFAGEWEGWREEP